MSETSAVCLQVDYCGSSEDYLRFEGSLIEQTLAQHLHEASAGQSQSAKRTITTLLGQAQCAAAAAAAAARAQLFPLDMQGNQVVLYSQASGLSLDTPAPPLGVSGGVVAGGTLKNPSLEHGAAHLSAQGTLGTDGADGGGMAGGSGGSSAGGGSGKVFMCHCGKTFTHKSMRDRHINMHLDLRPFHCPVCAKKFKMKHHLTEHMKTHTGLKPYDCLSCGKKFMWRDSFMRHRSHCERRDALGESGEGGSSVEARRGGGGAGGAGEDGPDFISSHHLLLAAGDGGQGILRGGRGASTSSPHLSVLPPQLGPTGSGSHGSAAGLSNSTAATGGVSQSPSQMFGGVGGVCEDDECEVGVNESSVT